MAQYFTKHYSHWVLLGGVYAISISLWLLTSSSEISSLYQFFPILGILAWVTMWVQCVTATTVRFGARSNARFSRWTGRVVLSLIILHPGIFLTQRFLDTGLLPPESYVSYVGPLRAWAIALAMAALATFLLYPVFRRFRRQLTARGVWPYIGVSQAIAMVAIFIHGLVVGTSMEIGYFALWWWLLGIVLVPCLVFQVVRDFEKSSARDGKA